MFLIIFGIFINILFSIICILTYNLYKIDNNRNGKDNDFTGFPTFVKYLIVISLFIPYMFILTMCCVLLYVIIRFITTEL